VLDAGVRMDLLCIAKTIYLPPDLETLILFIKERMVSKGPENNYSNKTGS
jgi:hypothetical protein